MLETFARLEEALSTDGSTIVLADACSARDAVTNLITEGQNTVFIDAVDTDHFGFIMALNTSQNATGLVILNMHVADESVLTLVTELLGNHSYSGRELSKLQHVIVTLDTATKPELAHA